MSCSGATMIFRTLSYFSRARIPLMRQTRRSGIVLFAHRRFAEGFAPTKASSQAYAMMRNNYVLCADKTLKYVSAKSVLKYEVGQAIRLSERDFILLSKVFLAEVERKYR